MVFNTFYFIEIYDNTTGKSWVEEFDSYYFFRKRYMKLKYSKKLFITAMSSLDER